MTRWLVVGLVLLVCLPAGAVPPADTALEKIQQDLARQRQPEYLFTQERRIAVLNRPVLSSGVLDFEVEKGLCWRLLQPYAMTLLINAEGIFQIEADSAPKRLMAGGNPVFETFSRVYMALFKGEFQGLEADFELAPEWHEAFWQITLTPRPNSPLAWLQAIDMERKAERIHLRLREKNGDQVDLAFSAVESTDNVTGTILCW